MHRAGHVFESRSCTGRIPLIAHLTPWLPKVRQYRKKTQTIFRLTAFTIPKLGAFPMLILVVVLLHLLEIFYCKTFLLRHVQNIDFCFPVLVFLLKTMGFSRFLLQDRQFLIMQHLLPPVASSMLIALSFLLDSLIIPGFVFPFLLV